MDFSVKLFTYYSQSSVATLNLISYVISAIALFGVFLIPEKNGEEVKVKTLLKSTWLPVLIMSVCLFGNSYFMALANKHLTPTQIYPVYQAGALVLGTIMSAVFFKEKVTLKCVIGMVLAGLAIILLR